MGKCYACGGMVDEYAKGGDVDREKGVHKGTSAKRGQSMSGYATREVHKGADVDKDAFKEYARGEHKRVLKEMKGMRRDRKNLAEGGYVEDEEMSGYHDMPAEGHMDDYAYPPDIIDEIMMGSPEGYSEGGKVANDTEKVEPGAMPAQYDDLVLRDDLEFSYDGKNSGDDEGNEQHDSEEDEELDEIMRSRKKKGQMPNPK